MTVPDVIERRYRLDMGVIPGIGLDGALPGEELVRAGIDDLAQGNETVEALLVSIGAPRLRALGIDLPSAFPDAEDRLFALLERFHPSEGHARYNALIRLLVSFERAAESLA